MKSKLFLVEETEDNKKLIEEIVLKARMVDEIKQFAAITESVVDKNNLLVMANMILSQKHKLFKLLNPEIATCRTPLFCDYVRRSN